MFTNISLLKILIFFFYARHYKFLLKKSKLNPTIINGEEENKQKRELQIFTCMQLLYYETTKIKNVMDHMLENLYTIIYDRHHVKAKQLGQ